jgi:hypothetical protein
MELVYRWPWFYGAGSGLLVLLLASWGWHTYRSRGFKASVAVLWLLALLMATVELPSYFLDEIRVDQQQMRWQAGPWWDRREGSIRFSDVRSVRVERRTSGSRRSQITQTIWVLESPSGTTDEAAVFDLWMDHYQDIEAHFVARGIVVTGGS